MHKLYELDCEAPGVFVVAGRLPGRRGLPRGRHPVDVVVHAADAGGGAAAVVEQARVILLVVVVVVLVDGVVLEAAVDEVAEGGRVVGEVVLLEQPDEVVKVKGDGVVLQGTDETEDSRLIFFLGSVCHTNGRRRRRKNRACLRQIKAGETILRGRDATDG